MKRLWLILPVFSLVVVSSQDYEVITIDNNTFHGQLINIDNNGIKLKHEYGIVEIPAPDIKIILYPAFTSEDDSLIAKLDRLLKETTESLSEMLSKKEGLPIDSTTTQNDKPPLKFIPYDSPPIPRSRLNPKYPKAAIEAGIAGTVVVQVFVNEKGRVTEMQILKGIPGLNDAAMEAIKKTRFKPAKRGRKAVGAWISIPINFRNK